MNIFIKIYKHMFIFQNNLYYKHNINCILGYCSAIVVKLHKVRDDFRYVDFKNSLEHFAWKLFFPAKFLPLFILLIYNTISGLCSRGAMNSRSISERTKLLPWFSASLIYIFPTDKHPWCLVYIMTRFK